MGNPQPRLCAAHESVGREVHRGQRPEGVGPGGRRERGLRPAIPDARLRAGRCGDTSSTGAANCFERTARARTYRGRRGQHPSQGGRSHPGVVRTTNAKIRAVAGCLRGLGPSTRVSCAYESVHGPRSRDADGRDSYGRLSSTDMDLYQPRGSAGRTHERIDVLHGPSRHLRIGRVVAGERRRLFRPRSTHSPSDARNRSQANTWGNAVRHHCANLGIRRSPSPHRIEFGTSGGLLRSQSARRHDRGNAGLVPIPQLVVVLALLGTVLLASWLPARRPSRIDPLQALRTD